MYWYGVACLDKWQTGEPQPWCWLEDTTGDIDYGGEIIVVHGQPQDLCKWCETKRVLTRFRQAYRVM